MAALRVLLDAVPAVSRDGQRRPAHQAPPQERKTPMTDTRAECLYCGHGRETVSGVHRYWSSDGRFRTCIECHHVWRAGTDPTLPCEQREAGGKSPRSHRIDPKEPPEPGETGGIHAVALEGRDSDELTELRTQLTTAQQARAVASEEYRKLWVRLGEEQQAREAAESRLDSMRAQWKDLERIQDRQLTLEALELELAEERQKREAAEGERDAWRHCYAVEKQNHVGSVEMLRSEVKAAEQQRDAALACLRELRHAEAGWGEGARSERLDAARRAADELLRGKAGEG